MNSVVNVATKALSVGPQTSGSTSDIMSAIITSFIGLLILGGIITGIVFAIKAVAATGDTASTEEKQLRIFRGEYDSLAISRQGIDSYLQKPEIQPSKNNWVLLNFAPLAVANAGYLGGGVYSTNAIRYSLALGFRCFIFDIDYIKTASHQPRLIYRDKNGVIRSNKDGNIKEMMTTLAEQAFTDALPTGKDPLIVVLNFKDTPAKTVNPAIYKGFLEQVSKEIQPLKKSLLLQIGETRFSNMQNQNALFVQNIQSLRGKTIIFTNADTSMFSSDPTTNPTNLRSMIHAQVYSSSGKDTETTESAPKGVIMAVGKESAEYYLTTPPENVATMKRSTNNVESMIELPNGNPNLSSADQVRLLTEYGVQIVPMDVFSSTGVTASLMKPWGSHSWLLKPLPLQYSVTFAAPAQVISKKANANQGNVSAPALRI